MFVDPYIIGEDAKEEGGGAGHVGRVHGPAQIRPCKGRRGPKEAQRAPGKYAFAS